MPFAPEGAERAARGRCCQVLPVALSITLKAIPMGIAYGIWSGVGIVLVSALGWLWFKQTLDAPAGRGRDGDCSPPPHRSVRAALPHTAPALSHDAKR